LLSFLALGLKAPKDSTSASSLSSLEERVEDQEMRVLNQQITHSHKINNQQSTIPLIV